MSGLGLASDTLSLGLGPSCIGLGLGHLSLGLAKMVLLTSLDPSILRN